MNQKCHIIYVKLLEMVASLYHSDWTGRFGPSSCILFTICLVSTEYFWQNGYFQGSVFSKAWHKTAVRVLNIASHLLSVFVIVIIAHGLAGWGPHAYFQMLAESRNEVQSSSLHANYHPTVRQPELESVYIDSHHTVGASRFNIRETSPILEERDGNGRQWH